MVYYYLFGIFLYSKTAEFSNFLQFKGNFVRGQNNSKIRLRKKMYVCIRNKDKFVLPKPRTEYMKQTFKYTSITLWKTLSKKLIFKTLIL